MDSAQGPMPAARNQKPYRFLASAAVAALLIVTSVFAAYLWSVRAPSYRTAVGGLATVPMDDGSKITLNTDSEITLAVSDTERRVNLRQGEAFFDVAKDPSRPFVVYAKDQRVVAVGTRFSVRLKPEGVQVMVTEGQVRLENKPSLLLTPGTVANAKEQRIDIQQEPVNSVELALSWRSGYVVLRKALLREAVAEFNRYNRRQLVLADPALGDIRVGGNFKSNNIEGFIRLLQDGFQVQAVTQGDHVLLTRR